MYDKLDNGLNGKLFCPLGLEGQIKGGLTNGVHSIRIDHWALRYNEYGYALKRRKYYL